MLTGAAAGSAARSPVTGCGDHLSSGYPEDPVKVRINNLFYSSASGPLTVALGPDSVLVQRTRRAAESRSMPNPKRLRLTGQPLSAGAGAFSDPTVRGGCFRGQCKF
jgi:hypothetical protein